MRRSQITVMNTEEKTQVFLCSILSRYEISENLHSTLHKNYVNKSKCINSITTMAM
jgi:hypothetical protein